MTQTGPRPADIVFDHAAAAAAIAGLDRAQAVMGDVADSRNRALATASTYFRGVYAEDLTRADGDLGLASNDARRNATALRAAISRAAEAALLAQAARGEQQHAWDRANVRPAPARVA
ncbi:MAG TPA: hypothetical protein VGO60_13405 [Iamia sp.]|jgi:hypothetical protein|nr:hypothetical protein [Iamia sp.]